MFGLTPEKFLLIGLVAVFVVGPQRLPAYAAKLATWVTAAKRMMESAKSRMSDEMGPEFDEIDWKKLDPRAYDPRRIIRSALLDDDVTPAEAPVRVSTVRRSSPAERYAADLAGSDFGSDPDEPLDAEPTAQQPSMKSGA